MVRMHNGVDLLQHQRIYCAFETVSNATHVLLSEGWRKIDGFPKGWWGSEDRC
jgi:hypothetical protein